MTSSSNMIYSVVILGASDNPSRYSYQAYHLLKSKGHMVYCINPRLAQISGEKCFSSISEVPQFHTLTIYLSPDKSIKLKEEIMNAKMQRVIFNPGAECPLLAKALLSKGIDVVEACTLVMLKTHQF